MTTAILNIGLSSNPPWTEEGLEAMLVTLRKGKTFEWLAKLGKDFYVEDRTHPVLDADHEPTIVAVVFDVRLGDFTDASVQGLCDDIGQWCIAVKFQNSFVYPRSVFGRLLGNGRARYEPFDDMKFLNPIRRIK